MATNTGTGGGFRYGGSGSGKFLTPGQAKPPETVEHERSKPRARRKK